MPSRASTRPLGVEPLPLHLDGAPTFAAGAAFGRSAPRVGVVSLTFMGDCAFCRWMDRTLPGPTNADRERLEQNWDYEQADYQPRDTEPCQHSLTDALRALHADPAAAFPLLRNLADEGSPIAMNSVGEAYLWGRGVPIDQAEAGRWFKSAAEHGNLRATLTYGRLLLSRREFSEAEAIFGPAAEHGFGPAAYRLARGKLAQSKRRGLRPARPLLERAVAQGSPAARSLFAAPMLLGLYGLRSVPRGWRLTRDHLKWVDQMAKKSRSVEHAPPVVRRQP